MYLSTFVYITNCYTINMSQHHTLYRKYRPQTLKEVLGQDAVVSLFTQVLTTGKIGHAYLFAGGRGTGKTSVARIIARELGTSPEDIYEIDAASNRGIDEIRLIRDGVHTVPFSSKYKVYIIDEAHMLTIQAANALLKTLEEPPAHCIFILATTDKEKLPATILSRCQVLEFKRADVHTLSQMINSVSEKEGYELESGVAERIAREGDSSFRDTLSILEKVFSTIEGKKITLESIETLIKKPNTYTVCQLIELCIEGDISGALSLAHILSENSSPADSVELIISKLRQAILLRFDQSGEYRNKLEKTIQKEEIEILHKIGLNTKKPITSNTIVEMIELYDLIKKSGSNQIVVLELCVIKLATKE
jgi:DNA polymerase III subunit gamma/tau